MLKNGMQIKNYKITKVLPLDEIQSTLIECTHIPTGALIVKLLNDDEENLFSLSFKTWPTKSDGVAHILEHTVLCGSKKYPVKDPFFSMTRRSLNTYMNALTGGDFTCYPAATVVKKDFYNLLSVYLDSTFHPILNPLSFKQEGHRLEFEQKEDAASGLKIKGIVFNEMKGALGNKEARLSEEIMHALYPDTTYGVNSGGDPRVIPELTYEELKAFHQKYYHPSHCIFFFYGNLPLEEQLDYLEEHAFKGVKKEESLGLLARQSRFTAPRDFIKYYPSTKDDENEEKVMVALGFLTCSILDQEELLALNVLDILLMGTDGSPLKMALLKSNLCKEADGLIDNEMNDLPYILICKGCKEGAAKSIEKLFKESLLEICKEGFSVEMIEGAIHQLEMARSEITGGSSPYGLSLFFRSILLKQHGGQVEDGLLIHSLFAHLRTRSPESYVALLQKHFLENPHRILIEMRPNEELGNQEEQRELSHVETLAKELSKGEKEKLVKEALLLADFQEKEEEEETNECLPTVTLSDVAKEDREYALEKKEFGRLTLYTHACFTNQMLYVDLISHLPPLSTEEFFYLRLFCYLLPQVGAGGRSYKENLDFMLQHTGGITAFFDLGQHISDPNQMRPYFCLRGKALDRKRDQLLTLMRETLESADFTDQERIQEILTQHLSGLESSIQRNPLRFGINLAASNCSTPSAIINQCYGLPYYWQLKKVVTTFLKDPKQLLEELEKMKEKVLSFSKADLVISADQKLLNTLYEEGFSGLEELCRHPERPWKGEFSFPKVSSQAREIPNPVSFTSILFPIRSYQDSDAALLSLCSEIMENCTLHSLIREQGGAYGSGAVFTWMSQQFYFYTYRDPNISASLTAFKEALTALCTGDFTEQDLTQAKLQIFQDLDGPLPPYARAYTAYTRLHAGRTPEVRSNYRKILFSANAKEIQESAIRCLQKELDQALLVTFASKELLSKEIPLIGKALPIYSIEDEDV